jgi:hypothetical protein
MAEIPIICRNFQLGCHNIQEFQLVPVTVILIHFTVGRETILHTKVEKAFNCSSDRKLAVEMYVRIAKKITNLRFSVRMMLYHPA